MRAGSTINIKGSYAANTISNIVFRVLLYSGSELYLLYPFIDAVTHLGTLIAHYPRSLKLGE